MAIFLFLTLTISPHAALGATVGMVTKVENQAQVGSQPAGVGTTVGTNDVLITGPGARMEVTFRDQTTLTLGENARVVVDRYVFNPEASTGALVLQTSGAAYRMATGRLGEMRNKNISVSTPAAALGVRGTDVWWGPIDGHHGVYLVHNARVVVRNQGGSTTLANGGEGTDLRRGARPSRAYRWPAGKVANALSQTNFGLAFGPGKWTPVFGAAAVATAFGISVSQDNSSLPPVPPPEPISP